MTDYDKEEFLNCSLVDPASELEMRQADYFNIQSRTYPFEDETNDITISSFYLVVLTFRFRQNW